MISVTPNAIPAPIQATLRGRSTWSLQKWQAENHAA